MKRLGLDVLTARIAIGSLCLVSAFLAACGFHNLFPFIEELTKTKTWEILVAVPVLVFSYALGAVVSQVSDLAFSRRGRRDEELQAFARFSAIAPEAVISQYDSLRRELEFVRALVPTIGILGLSVWWSASQVLFGGVRRMAMLAGAVTFLTAPAFILLARRLRRDMVVLAEYCDARENRMGSSQDVE